MGSTEVTPSATLVESFEDAFGPLLQGAHDMFSLDDNLSVDTPDGESANGGLVDISGLHAVEAKLKEARKKNREIVDAARNDLRAMSRTFEQQRLSATRSPALPSQQEHEARMAIALADRRAKMKQNGELEQTLYRLQADVERLQQELKEEEADAFEVSELNGEVLRLKLYRDFGFTPVEENGTISKVLVPPSTARRVKSIRALSEAGSALAMDVDEAKEDGEKVLVRDESFVVLERKGLPAEVEELLMDADPYTDPFRACLDSQTGFAYVISRECCYRTTSPTTYLFPLPPSLSLPANVSVFSPLSFASFVPTATHQNQREPGLLIISTTGDIRFWDNVSMALSGVDRFKTVAANLQEGELVRGLVLASPTSYLVSTSQSRVLVISIASSGGRSTLSVRPFDRARGWAGSVWSAVFGGKGPDPRAGILALALSNASRDGERMGYAVTDKNVQVWRIPKEEGGERLVVEQDLFAGVLEGIKGEKVGNEEWALNEGQVEIVDAKVSSDGALAVLVSHVADSTTPNKLSYAVVSLNVGAALNTVAVQSVKKLAYQAHPDPRPLSTPSLSLLRGDTAFVTFVDAVVMLSLASESTFEEVFPLRSSSNRFLGASVNASTSPNTYPCLSLLTSTASLLTVEVTSVESIQNEQAGSEEHKTRKLKGKIEQGIYFGGNDADNPLAFDLLPDFEGDLIAASEAVSQEILSSSSAHMPYILDLRAQLADRVLRARALIEYIGSNGLLGKLSQSARRRLSWDAEKLSAAVALWHYQNSRLGGGPSLLSTAVDNFMTEIGEGFSEDPVRVFFRTQVSSIGLVLEHVTKLAKSTLAASGSSDLKSPTLQEANHLVLLVFNAVARFRADSGALYGLDPNLHPLEAWSSRPIVLENLQWHFDSTDALLRERSRELGTSVDDEQPKYTGRSRGASVDVSNQQVLQAELKKQMASLADFVFGMYEERLSFLRTINADTGSSPESRVITERYLSLRPRFIRTLVSIGKVTNAYDLAERYRDFRSLVELCNDGQHGSPGRIRLFMQKYSEEFAFALYHFYVEKGQLRVLMEQDDEYRPLLTKFLDETGNPRVAWLNDIAIGRFAHATETLVSEAASESDLAQKKLLLSLGKLSQIAQASKETIETEDVQRAIEAVDDALDIVNSQHGLKDLFVQSLSNAELQLPVAEQGELVTTRIAPSLAQLPSFAQLYTKLVSDLLQGRTLSAEDLIDLLTLKETTHADSADFSSALEILVRAKDLPEGRKEVALQNIWRRVYLRDDWASLRAATELKDEEVANALRNTALFATLTGAAGADHPASMYLRPLESLFTGSAEELAARFPDAPSHLIDLLLNDYESENQSLREAVQQHMLDDYCSEVARLMGEEVGEVEGAVGDDSMMED
ncbi:nuclear pore complex protein Nup133 [Pseudohyphozyma bogoriensis]|nr:nuclear pore complex protein Nup133 [Pseudohyphozyma bogoriensis]